MMIAIIAAVTIVLLLLAWFIYMKLRPIEVAVDVKFNHPPLWKTGGQYIFLISSCLKSNNASLDNVGLAEVSIDCLPGTNISNAQTSATNWTACIDDRTKTLKAKGPPTMSDLLLCFEDAPSDQSYTLRPLRIKYTYQYKGWMRKLAFVLKTYPREKTGMIKVPTPYPLLGTPQRPQTGDLNKYRSHQDDLTKTIKEWQMAAPTTAPTTHHAPPPH